METLLQLQPLADTVGRAIQAIWIISIIVAIISIIVYLVGGDTVSKRTLKYSIFSILTVSVLYLPVGFVSHSWDMFKNQMIYKISTSETAEKTVDNINLLMDKLRERIEVMNELPEGTESSE